MDFIIVKQGEVEILTIHGGRSPAGRFDTPDEPVGDRLGGGEKGSGALAFRCFPPCFSMAQGNDTNQLFSRPDLNVCFAFGVSHVDPAGV